MGTPRILAAVAALAALAACGGKVVVDGAPGDGGAGGATSSSTSTSSGPTTGVTTGPSSSVSSSSGPVCDCQTVCDTLQGCGIVGPECQSFCDQIPDETKQCVCFQNGDCKSKQQCLGGVGTGGSGGGKGEPSSECFECLDSSSCTAQMNDCFADPECEALVQCHVDHGWTYESNGVCDPMFPGGYPEWYALMDCAVCGACYDVCADSSLVNYCFDG